MGAKIIKYGKGAKAAPLRCTGHFETLDGYPRILTNTNLRICYSIAGFAVCWALFFVDAVCNHSVCKITISNRHWFILFTFYAEMLVFCRFITLKKEKAGSNTPGPFLQGLLEVNQYLNNTILLFNVLPSALVRRTM